MALSRFAYNNGLVPLQNPPVPVLYSPTEDANIRAGLGIMIANRRRYHLMPITLDRDARALYYVAMHLDGFMVNMVQVRLEMTHMMRVCWRDVIVPDAVMAAYPDVVFRSLDDFELFVKVFGKTLRNAWGAVCRAIVYGPDRPRLSGMETVGFMRQGVHVEAYEVAKCRIIMAVLAHFCKIGQTAPPFSVMVHVASTFPGGYRYDHYAVFIGDGANNVKASNISVSFTGNQEIRESGAVLPQNMGLLFPGWVFSAQALTATERNALIIQRIYDSARVIEPGMIIKHFGPFFLEFVMGCVKAGPIPALPCDVLRKIYEALLRLF